MRKYIYSIIIIPIILISNLYANDSLSNNEAVKKLVFTFDIKQQIGPAVWRITKKSIDEAENLNADYIIIQMNTYGGMVDAADSIRTKILNSKIPVYVFIDNNAASAGALISVACDSIYMRPGANIGAATVVNQSGEKMPDKYQAYMRSMMRATAESHGQDTIINGNDTIFKWYRNPQIAEAMVDEDLYIKGIIDTGKVLTFTTQEAIKYGFCEGKAENLKDVLHNAGINEYEIKHYEITPMESIIGFLVNPLLSGLLIMIIIGGIYFELQTPGIGFPLAAAILAAILYFAPLYLEGLAANWEILVFALGVVLIALEIFVIPGFGIAGISGILLMITGLTLSLVDNIVFTLDSDSISQLLRAFLLVITSIFFSLFVSIWAGIKLLNSSALSFLVLNSSQKKEDGFVAVSNEFDLVGKDGQAMTILRPSGKIMIDGEYYDAKCQSGYIEKGENVKVIKYTSGQLYVKKNTK